MSSTPLPGAGGAAARSAPLLEYVTLPLCSDCTTFEAVLARVRADSPGIEARAVPADSARGRHLSVEHGILRFPIIVLNGEVIAVESITEDELRLCLRHALESQPDG